MLRREDLSRPIKMHCCKDGTITYRKPGEPVFNGKALPVFSTDTKEQAEMIRVRFCSMAHGEHPLLPGQVWYALPNFSGELEELGRVTDMFRSFWDEHYATQ